MRAIVARRLRRTAYGKGTHPGQVGYFICNRQIFLGHKNLIGCCVSDEKRRAYQALKKTYKKKLFTI